MISSYADHPEKNYPQDYFESPVLHDLLLSGTFGELRSNHFHSGIDIKPSNGGIGDAVVAAAGGQVVRISVSSSGFGNALYVQHPNGYITVYAHLHNFVPEIARYVKENQYKRKSFSVNLYPDGLFPVSQGERIGILGNSGSSTGAHLHFEIRRASDSKPINPLYFGFQIEDQVKPDIKHLIIYELDYRLNPIKRQKISLNYNTTLDTIIVQSKNVGVGIQSYDQMNNLRNKNGVFRIEKFVDSTPTFQLEFESFHFSETRYLNAHTDYSLYSTDRIRAHRLYNAPGNKFSLCNPSKQKGLIQIENNESKQVAINVQDYNGNTEHLKFIIKGSKTEERLLPKNHYTYMFKYDQINVINTREFNLEMPEDLLYEDAPVSYVATNDVSDGLYSATHILSADPIPVHKYFTIKIKPNTTLHQNRSKAFIANCAKSTQTVSCGGTWKDGFVVSQVRELGNYVIMLDTIPPTVEPLNFSNDMSKHKEMSFRIEDNIPTSGKAKGISYQAYIDGEWILFEYDAKKNRIFHTFDGRIDPGNHELKILVTDDRKNVNIYKREFSI